MKPAVLLIFSSLFLSFAYCALFIAPYLSNVLIEYLVFIIVLVLAVVASIVTRKLTVAGGITGGIIAILIYLGVGLVGIVLLGLFFLLGTLATAWRADVKRTIYVEEKESGPRTAGQVLANGGIAGMLGLMAIRFPINESLFLLAIAGSLSSAVADTLSSELGSVYGKRFYNILSWKKEQRGLDGVISIEGLLIGIAGSALIAFIYSLYTAWDACFGIIILAGTIGNITDSIAGAALERKGWLKNDAVNFLNTLTSALVAGAIYIAYIN